MRIFLIILGLLLLIFTNEVKAQLISTDMPSTQLDTNNNSTQQSTFGKKLKNTFYQGDIGVGQEYGLLPILLNPTPPDANTRIQGSVGFKIKILPFKTTFLYSTTATASGLNNYFTLEFDVEKFIQLLKEEQMKQQQAIMAKKDSLMKVKQTIVQKIAFYEMSMKDKILDSDAIKKEAEEKGKDSLKSLNKEKKKQDSGRKELYAKKDEMYLIRKDKKCIKDSLKIDMKSIKLKNKEALAKEDVDKKDKQEIKLQNKRRLEIAKSTKEYLLDSLAMYKADIKHKLKKKKKEEKKAKKKISKKDAEASKQQASDSLAQYQNLNIEKPSLDSLNMDSLKNSATLDSLNQTKAKAFEMNEESKNKYKELKNELKEIDQSLAKLDVMNQVNLDDQKQALKQKKGAKVLTFLSYIKKFELGIINPNHSYFLVNNMPMTGINVEYSQNKAYVAFTYGKTINNIFLTSNFIQNSIYKMKNLYNFFDFTNIDEGRRITALKLGYGEKEKTHLYIGGMYGVGKTNYLNQSSDEKERNYVLEIDGKWLLNEKHSIDAVYGRSALQIDNVNYGEQSSVFEQLLGFQDRTNAALIQSNSSFFKNRTTLKLTYRIIDPFFKSFGVGFLRNDNIRYEAKLKQKLSKKLTVGGFIRREEDNLLNMYAYKNLLIGYGVDATFRLTKKITLKADYRPVVQRIMFKDEGIDITNHNQILNLIATHNNRIKNTTLNVTGVYSLYNLQNDSVVGVYHNYNISSTIGYKDKWEEMFSYNRFQSNDTSSVARTDFFQNDFTWMMKKVDITLMAKYSISDKLTPQVGYGTRLKYRITKYLSWSLSGEKLVLGDYYNSLAITGANQYPYFFYTTLNVVW